MNNFCLQQSQILAEGLQYSVQLQFSLMAAQLQHYSTFSYLLQLCV